MAENRAVTAQLLEDGDSLGMESGKVWVGVPLVGVTLRGLDLGC